MRGLTSACRAYEEVIKTAETGSSAVHKSTTRYNRHKLKLGAFRLNIRRNFFMMRTVKQGNSWPREVVQSPLWKKLSGF